MSMMNIQQALKYASPDNKVVGLLFSADYCKYCHIFVPQLREIYHLLKENNIEIVFVASDKTEEAFQKYLPQHSMWQFIDYDDDIRVQLREMYQIKTIPALLFFDQSGTLIEKNGRDLVANAIQNNSDKQNAATQISNYLGCVENNYDSDNSDF